MNEKINKLKLCTICSFVDDKKDNSLAADLHEQFGWHFTNGKTWVPAKGHPQFEQHERARKLLNLK